MGFAVEILVTPGVESILRRGEAEKVDFSVDFLHPGNAPGSKFDLFKRQFHGNASLSVCLPPLYSRDSRM